MAQEFGKVAPNQTMPTRLTDDETHGQPGERNLIRRPNLLRTFPNSPRWGVSRSRYMLRTALLAAGLVVVALAIIVFGNNRWTDAGGISLIVPGGGFLYDGWPILFVATWALFWLGWNFWVGFGTIFHVSAVYLLAILGSIALADGPRLGMDPGTTWPWAIPVLLLGAAFYVGHHLLNAARGRSRDIATRKERLEYLANLDQSVIEDVIRSFDPPELRPAMQVFDPIGVTGSENYLQPPLPVTDGDAALVKYLLEISMQPISSFEGWDWGGNAAEPAALRYQTTDTGISLAFLQANFIPAYPSLIEQAQRNVIAKTQEIPVWGYWYFENFFGTFKRNPDPISGAGHQNIMFSGFLAKHLAHYEAVTHDHRYDEPNSLQFTWEDGRTWSYSFPQIAAHGSSAFIDAPMGMWPCEPGQVYTVCNQIGATGVQGFGALHDSDEWSSLQGRYAEIIDREWTKLNGDIHGHFNLRLGMNVGSLTWNDGTSPMFVDGNQFLYLFGRTLTPEVAARMYLLGKNAETFDYLPIVDGALRLPNLENDGSLPKTLKSFFIRFPNFRHFLSGSWVNMTKTGFAASNAVMYGAIADLARQFGRDDIADAAIRGLDKVHLIGAPSAGRPYHASLATIHMIARARWGRLYKQDDFLTARIPRYEGPVLASAPHPELLVTYANGRDEKLCITVEPTMASGSFPLTFERLAPLTEYIIGSTGVAFRTDYRGTGSAFINLTERTTMLITPNPN